MNMKNKIITNLILLVSLSVVLSPIVNAASQIEIIPTEQGMRNVNVSTAFVTCRNLDSTSSTLGTTGLDPHLTTNLDWGAVSYLANSNYGVGANGHTIETQGKAGKKITVTEKVGNNNVDYTYYSTTGNATGIMDWGANPTAVTYTQTAGILNSATEENTGNSYNNVKVLLTYNNTRYVEKLSNINNTVGMAISETVARPDWTGVEAWNIFNPSSSYPIMTRNGLFGFNIGQAAGWYYNGGGGVAGEAKSDSTFRPVIWNIN